MSTLIDRFASDRVRGGRFVFAYATGALWGVILAVAAVLALIG